MKQYSEKFKAAMVQRMIGANGMSASALAEEVGVSPATLYNWRREAAQGGSLNGTEKESSMSQRPQDKNSEEKLRLVIEASALDEEALGAFLRREGIHSTHLEQWRSTMLAGLEPRRRANPQLRELKKKNKRLEKELSRKDAALAETAALLVLQKKVQSLWGDEDAST